MFWRSANPVITNESRVDELLSRSVHEVVVHEDLKKDLLSGRRLRVKLGIDPTGPFLHLGHAVLLLKLRDFQNLGHHVVLVIGDATGVVGDTSDKESERPMLSPEQVETNLKTYTKQAEKILDLSRVEIRRNSTWLLKLTYREIGAHADQFSVSDFISRDLIKRRLDAGKRVSLRETLYPLMQGYDSVAVRADVEIGGTDQRFNMLAGRTLQEREGQHPQNIVVTEIISGLDGRKMSKSYGNDIKITDTPDDMFGKLMSINDALITPYFTHCTRVSVPEIQMITAGHPRDAKMRLAREVVALYHGEDTARAAEETFGRVFGKKEAPENIPEVVISSADTTGVALIQGGVAPSRSELRRLADAGAIENIDTGEKITTLDTPAAAGTYRIGKHRFIKITVR